MNSATAQAVREISGRLQEAYEIARHTIEREKGDEFLSEIRFLLGHVDRFVYRSLAVAEMNGELPKGLNISRIQVFPPEIVVDLSGPFVNAEWQDRRPVEEDQSKIIEVESEDQEQPGAALT